MAKDGGSTDTTVVNPTLLLTGPAEYHGDSTAEFVATTTPAGLAIEASLDGAAYARVDGTWQVAGLAAGSHTLTARVVGAAASARTIAFTVDTTDPDPPTGPVVATAAAGTLAISWTAGADAGVGLAAYHIDYGTTAGGPFPERLTITAPATSATLTGLSACQVYHLQICCEDRAGNPSSATTEVSGRAACGGDGTFTSTSVTVGTTAVVAKGDFNTDGIPDYAVDEGDSVRIVLGTGNDGRGDGGLAIGEAHDTGSTVVAIVVADVTADRIDDIVLLNETQLKVYVGDGSNGVGDGTFTPLSSTSSNLANPQALLVRDVNADGILDAVVGNWDNSTLVTMAGGGSGGRGDGTFSFLATVGTGSAPGAIAAGDFNADGIIDVAVACQSGSEVLVTHLGNGASGAGSGSFAAKQTWLTGGFVAGDVLVADMNSDGIDDLVTTLTLANIVCFMAGSGSGGRGNGVFYLDEVVPVGTRPWGLVTGEFTGDGIPDFVSLSYLSAGATLIESGGEHARGDGTFTTAIVGGTGSSLFRGVGADVDGNGSDDLVLGSLGGALLVLQNGGNAGIGDGTFRDRGNDLWTIGTAFGVTASDFNSDRVPDLIVAAFQIPYAGGNDLVWLFLGGESQGLGTGVLSANGNPAVGAGPTAFATGDFNRDHIADVAVLASDLEARGGGNRVDALIGDGSAGVGNGGFSSSTDEATGTMPRGIVAGDFDENGIQDLAVADQGSNTVTVLIGQGSGGRGDGTFSAAAPMAAGTGPFAIATGDFDADGILDLAVGNYSGSGSGALTILIGQGSNGRGDGTFAAGAAMALTHGITGLAVGDFNADGILDLAAAIYRLTGATGGSGVIVFTGDGSGGRGDGTFTAGAEIAIGGNAIGVATADFNRDNIPDLAVANAAAANAKVLLGNGSSGRGDGTFASPTTVSLVSVPTAITTSDLDSDGVPDLVAVGEDRIALRYGNGSF
ncbi:MAG: VCBS repeat-containing protein [Planctomycetes bacterium]|nr:VCBS repeat-containing protein [Planctomycetota bacterium]